MMGLELHDLSCGYGGTPVLSALNLEVEPGEVLAIVGPNGVGKSTLIRAASGSLKPLAGSVSIGGQDLALLNDAQRAQRVSVVSQALNLPEAYTVMDVVLMGRTPYLNWFEKESLEDHRAAMDALERTEMQALAWRRIGELSGGEQQRTIIARALAQATPVMLFDEPTAHLDLRHQERLLRLIRSLAEEERLAVLIALHDLNLVARLADRVALVSNGKIDSLGRPENVLHPDTLQRVYGIKIHVMTHPINGNPLILPADEGDPES
jgi:iron complex transport system ATP-binding protein